MASFAAHSAILPPNSLRNPTKSFFNSSPFRCYCTCSNTKDGPTNPKAAAAHPLSSSALPTHKGFGLWVEKPEKKESFSQTSAVRQLTGSLTAAEGLRFAIVVARFNEIITKPLLEGALDTFKKYSVKEEDVDVVWVPGSFEIGLVAEKLGKSRKYQAVLCIGAVVRGDTSHYDAVANSAASGVLSAGLSSGYKSSRWQVGKQRC